MKILFLDDDEDRHARYSLRSIGHEVHHVRTSAEAIDALKHRGPYDVADLDHDLGGLQMVEPGLVGHGGDVARHLEQNPECARIVVLHTFNQPAAFKMAMLMGEAPLAVAYAPFGTWAPNA